jgi:hypothetical protein
VCVINCVTKYQNAEFKEDKYLVNEVETQLREKHSGAAKPRIFTIQKTRLVTKHSYSHIRYAVVILCTLTCTYT